MHNPHLDHYTYAMLELTVLGAVWVQVGFDRAVGRSPGLHSSVSEGGLHQGCPHQPLPQASGGARGDLQTHHTSH